MNEVSWDNRFIDLAKHISLWSKDKSKGVGAVIVDTDNRVVSMGYNGFPSGFDDSIIFRYDRPQKYIFTEHAERNAIYNAARKGVSTIGCCLYITMFPCHDCARAIIQSGIFKIVCESPPDFKHERWGDSFNNSLNMMVECGVEVKFLN